MSTPLPAEIRELLEAVHEALAIPHPATVGDAEVFQRVLEKRASYAQITLERVLAGALYLDLEWETAYLKDRLREHPATGYRVWGDRP